MSHMPPKNKLRGMLDEFIIYGKNKSKFLNFSYFTVTDRYRLCKGMVVVADEVQCLMKKDTVKYSWRWIKKECRSRGIKWKKLPRHLNIGNQIWICLYLT